jgi:hypothetical protein
VSPAAGTRGETRLGVRAPDGQAGKAGPRTVLRFLAQRLLAQRAPAHGALAAALLAGCGGIKAPDLFVVQRSGSVAGARLTLLVNDEGGVHCNGTPAPKLSDAQLIEARALQEDLRGPASRHLSLPAAPGSVLAYYVRSESGAVRFSDNSSGQPAVLRKLALFVLQVAQGVCHLPQQSAAGRLTPPRRSA